MARSILLLLFAACSFKPLPAADDPGDGGTSDSPMVVDAPPGSVCVGAGTFELCTSPEVTGTVMLQGAFDTETSPSCATALVSFTTQGLHPEVCFVIGGSITATDLVVSGDRPLVLASQGAITLVGTIDVSARGNGRGAGARNTCTAGTQPDRTGGGAGGTYNDAGGLGGDGDNRADTGGAPGTPESTLVALRGGCPGQAGDGEQGDGGEGGGVFYAGAKTTLAMTGATINASGSGGEGGGGGGGGGAGNGPGGGPDRGGGGGGGSGGVVYLFGGDEILATGAIVVANGGGGGGGGTNNNEGTDGGDPDMVTPDAAAAGGDGGANGGPGFPGTNRRGQNGNEDQGGGGGGGGPGHIVANRALAGAVTVLPAP